MARKNIFTVHQDYEKKPDRNTFDLSFANNLTTKFGQLTPVFLKECSPGDSFRIKPHAAFQFMPMQFPIQTPMRAYLHFFKTRNRTMWKDWMDFIGGTKKNLVHPYVQPVNKKKFYRVGGLADYLGVPNVVYSGNSDGEGGSAGASITFEAFPVDGFNMSFDGSTTNGNKISLDNWISTQHIINLSAAHFWSLDDFNTMYADTSTLNSYINTYASNIKTSLVGQRLANYLWNIPTNPTQRLAQLNEMLGYENPTESDDGFDIRVSPPQLLAKLDLSNRDVSQLASYSGNLKVKVRNGVEGVESSLPFGLFLMYTDEVDRVLDFVGISGKLYDATGIFESNLPFGLIPSELVETVKNIYLVGVIPSMSVSSKVAKWSSKLIDGGVDAQFVYSEATENRPVVIGEGNYSNTPYDEDIRLNALPFRAYECVYNAYYRNSVNDPFKPDGVNPEYNKFLPTYEGGEDTTQYDLYFRNWEYDFLTSAIPTPQFGNAPLVGLTSTGTATVEDSSGNRFIVQAQLDSEGEITGWTTKKENDPSGSLRMLMSMATTGISINDLRNVNAYQRFLENAIRKGLSYRDQILAHYGVSVRYDELDMPEFIGGASCSIQVNKINQLSEGGSTPLGSFVGQAEAEMHGKHEISEYCDEHGFIIGILSIVPMPVYSQLLPSVFTRSEQLDYYFPEFKHVGYQPIPQKLVSPLQTFYNGGDLNKTFGYNRAFYDLIASTDEVHGQFRTTMRDFIMNRTFENEPVLGGDFLHVDPDQLNDVFLAGDLDNSDGDNIYAPDADKIIGSMYFEVMKKSPISLYGIAKLE